ncbi:MAG: hypothetical protein AAFV25_15755 [Bacteroidota bacterium]
MFRKIRARSKKRKKDIMELATRLGMNYAPKDEYGLKKLLKDFDLFRTGHSRSIINLISHQTGMESETSVFDYRYVIQAGNTPVKVEQTVVFIQSKRLSLPFFRIKPKNLFQRIGNYFRNKQPGQSQSRELFEDDYTVRFPDEGEWPQMVSDKLMQLFNDNKGIRVEGVGYFLILYRTKKVLPAQEWKPFHDLGQDIFDELLRQQPS